jgi:hypothetical protein
MLLPQPVLKRLGQRALQLIEEGVRDGIDIEGKPYAYSTKPFVRPLGGPDLNATQLNRVRTRIRTEGKRKPEDKTLQPFTTERGSLWVRIPGGYKSWKELVFNRVDGGPFLQGRGDMLRAMAVTQVSEDAVTLGFTDPEQAQKAFWLNVSGAGKSRKLWRFFGLRPEQQQALLPIIAPEYRKATLKALQTPIERLSKGG